MVLTTEKMTEILIGVVIFLTLIVVVFVLLDAFTPILSTSATCIAAETTLWGSIVSLLAPGGIVFNIIVIAVFVLLIILAFRLIPSGGK